MKNTESNQAPAPTPEKGFLIKHLDFLEKRIRLFLRETSSSLGRWYSPSRLSIALSSTSSTCVCTTVWSFKRKTEWQLWCGKERTGQQDRTGQDRSISSPQGTAAWLTEVVAAAADWRRGWCESPTEADQGDTGSSGSVLGARERQRKKLIFCFKHCNIDWKEWKIFWRRMRPPHFKKPQEKLTKNWVVVWTQENKSSTDEGLV